MGKDTFKLWSITDDVMLSQPTVYSFILAFSLYMLAVFRTTAFRTRPVASALTLDQRHWFSRPVLRRPLAPRDHSSSFSTMPLLDPLSSIVFSLKKEQIIPDVIPESYPFVPSVLFSVAYPSGHEVVPGKELTKDDTIDEPDIILTPMGLPDQGTQQTEEPSYTLVMTDPDAPSRADPKYRQFRHWVVSRYHPLSLLHDRMVVRLRD